MFVPVRVPRLGRLHAAVSTVFFLFVAHTVAEAPTTVRIPAASDGTRGNQMSSGGGSVSADGHYVALTTSASNLVPGETNRSNEVLLRDTVAGTTSLASMSSDGLQVIAIGIRWAAGIASVPPGYLGRFDVVPNGVVDLRDAVRIARKAVGLEANP